MARRADGRGEPDYVLIMTVATLMAIGLLMVYSSSYIWAVQAKESPSYYFVRQSMWAVVGIIAALAAYLIPHKLWQRLAIPVMASVLLALLVLLFAGQRRFGAVSTFFRGSVQPSELAKVAMIIYLSSWLASKGDKVKDLSYGLLPFGILLGLIAGLIVLEPDLGAAMVVVAIAIIMFFLAGAEIPQVLLILGAGALTAVLLFMTSGNAQTRIEDFLALIRDPAQGGHPHVRAAMQALARGGLFGGGIPSSVYKGPGGVPLPFSDSIFVIIGEEMGMLGSWFVLGLYALLSYRGFRVAMRTEDAYARLLAAGLTCWFTLQALLNIAVNTGMAPYTGLTLPFISHGGSSLVSLLAGVGLLLNVSRYADGEVPQGVGREDPSIWRRDSRARVSTSHRGTSSAERRTRQSALARLRASTVRTANRFFGRGKAY